VRRVVAGSPAFAARRTDHASDRRQNGNQHRHHRDQSLPVTIGKFNVVNRHGVFGSTRISRAGLPDRLWGWLNTGAAGKIWPWSTRSGSGRTSPFREPCLRLPAAPPASSAGLPPWCDSLRKKANII